MPGPAASVQLGGCEVEVGIVAGASDHFYVEQSDVGKWAQRDFGLQSRLWRGLCDEGHLNG